MAAKRAAKKRPSGEQHFDGIGVATGIAIGPAHVIAPGSIEVPIHVIAAKHIKAERARFADAVAQAGKQIEKLRTKAMTLPGSAAEELCYLLDAHALMLADSRLVRGVDKRIADKRINAEAAVAEELTQISAAFAEMEDDYLSARLQDVRDVGGQLLRALLAVPYQAFSDLEEGTVIIAEELTPADTALMDPERVGGFATVLGGPQGHTAIMARSLGLPATLGIADLIHKVHQGDMVVVDGGAGRVVVNPTASTLTHYRARQADIIQRQRQLTRLKSLPATTRDDVTITLHANIELPGEVAVALKSGAEGIGLVRTEFMFMNREQAPSEDEQYAALREIIEPMEGRPVTLRTLDAGSDKLAFSLAEHIAPSVNPALGLRAIRLSLKLRPLLEAQLGAMLRAGAHGSIRILLPMIGSAAEVRKVREVMDKVVRRLRRKRIKIADPLPPIGAMIEVPAAALAADSLSRVCDFFSIGTNDLTMYTLAIDRGDEQVASLYNPLHPAVLRVMQMATESALRARIPVNICGEIAGDPRYSALLLGLGIRHLSMSSMGLPLVKQRIRALSLDEATRRVRTMMEQSDSGVIGALLDDFNAVV